MESSGARGIGTHRHGRSSACVTRPQHDHPSSMGYRPVPALPAHRPGTPARVLAPSLRAPLQQRGRGQRLHPTQRPPTSPPHGKASWWEGTPLPPPPPLEVSRVVRGGPLELGLADPDLGSQAAPPSPGSIGTKPPFEERGGAGPLSLPSPPPHPAPAPFARFGLFLGYAGARRRSVTWAAGLVLLRVRVGASCS